MTYDLIIVGLGGMGSAALFQAAKAGLNVLGIDRFDPPHDMGSSHAETRITRLAVGEGAQYLPLVARSHEIWRELESETGEALLHQCGLYIITPPGDPSDDYNHWAGFVERTAEIAKGGRIPFSRLTPEDARARHPQLAIRDGDLVGYEPTGGVVLSERAIAAQLRLARALGAQTLVNEPVSNVEFGSASATVVTSQGRHTAAKVIVTAGAWMPEFMPETRRELLRVTRQTVHWFAVDEPERFFPDNFSAAVWAGDRLEDYLGVFPIIPDGILALKILTEQYEETTDPNTTDRTVHAEESAHFFNTLVSDRLKGVTPNCVKASACLYTHTPNDHFLIDWHPDCQHVLLASPCSSHGFKHSAAIGEALMQTATMGRSDLDLSSFSLAQFD